MGGIPGRGNGNGDDILPSPSFCSQPPVLNLFHSEPGNAIWERNVDAAFHECGTVKSLLEETLVAIPDWVLEGALCILVGDG
ncbi:hypothetical protein Droror1_Dr00011779 [Drosera rotundifolia]